MSIPRITMLMQMLNTFLSPIEKSNHFCVLFSFFLQPFREKNEDGCKYLIFFDVCDVPFDCHIWLFDFLQ